MTTPLTRPTERKLWPWLLRADTFPGLVRLRAQATPDALFLLDEHGTELTCAQFAEKVERVAAALAAEGIGAGSRVAWQLPTRISTVLVMAALRRLGAVQAPVIPLYREREVTVALATTGAEFFLVPGTWRGVDYVEMATGVAAAGGPAPRVLVVGEEAPESGDTAALPPEPADPDEVRWVYFTSGSTGAPKGTPTRPCWPRVRGSPATAGSVRAAGSWAPWASPWRTWGGSST
jgi:cyclohexanecarboxylate-CoA ligase